MTPTNPPVPGAGADYEKTFQVNAEATAVFDALTTAEGLAAWWTGVQGCGEAGGELRFDHGFADPLIVQVTEAHRPTSVSWSVRECHFLPDWVGTHPRFSITPLGPERVEVHFRHQGLTPELDCIEMCTRGWDHYLPSLRRYAESGSGQPRGSAADRGRRAAERSGAGS